MGRDAAREALPYSKLRDRGQLADRGRGAIAAQQEDLRDLAGIIGGLPIPRTRRIARTEGPGHRPAKRGRVERPPCLKQRKNGLAGREKPRRGLSR